MNLNEEGDCIRKVVLKENFFEGLNYNQVNLRLEQSQQVVTNLAMAPGEGFLRSSALKTGQDISDSDKYVPKGGSTFIT